MANPFPSPHFIPRPQLTELARKYTHPRGGPHQVLEGLAVLKSGLTPIDFVPYQTVEEYIIAFALRAYQTERFSGFTTLHLRTVDAFAPAINYPTDLTLDGLPIHPMYAKENWSKAPYLKHSPKLPIGDGTRGYFDVNNPILWNAMLPGIRLASQLLIQAHTFQWYDALFMGDKEIVPESELSDDFKGFQYKFRRIRLRKPHLAGNEDARQIIEERLLQASKKVRFDFVHSEGETNGMYSGRFTYGITYNEEVMLSTLLFSSLLDPTLTTGERASETFRFAATLAHETAHKHFIANVEPWRQRNKWGWAEPYFEDEVISELGYSLEKAIFGELGREITTGISPERCPVGGILQRTYPSQFFAPASRVPDGSKPIDGRNSGRLKNVPPSYYTERITPVPTAYFIDLHNPSFWIAHATRYSSMSTHMSPDSVSVVKTYDPASNQVTESGVHWTDAFLNRTQIPIDQSKMVPAEIFEAHLENERTRRAFRIRLQVAAMGKDSAEWPNFPLAAEAIEDSLRGRQPAPRPVFPDPPLICPRFPEIQGYLFQNRLELALDTTPRLPLPTLWHYILENGGLNINLDELRTFVMLCDGNQFMFSWDYRGLGSVSRRTWGWPTTRLRDRPIPKQKAPHSNRIKAFLKCADAIMANRYNWHDPFRFGLQDHDLDDFRKRINRELRVFSKTMKISLLNVLEKGTGLPFDRTDMDTMLYYLNREGSRFIYGPKGIIRIVYTSNPPIDQEDPPNKEKCNQQ